MRLRWIRHAACCVAAAWGTLFAAWPAYAEKPLAAIAGIESRDPRARGIAGLMEERLVRVLESAGVFGLANPSMLKSELAKFGCVDERCVLAFARRAGFDCLITGRAVYMGEYTGVELCCYGTAAPHNGKLLYRRSMRIPNLSNDMPAQAAAYLCEEQAGAFIARLLRAYRRPLGIVRINTAYVIKDAPSPINGNYTVYRYRDGASGGDYAIWDTVGVVKFRNNAAAGDAAVLREGDFILYLYAERADFLDDFFYGRKREIVFERPSLDASLYAVLFSAPASVSMPVMAPLGYYAYGDYMGLSLWAVNSAPYLYLGGAGLLHRPKTFRRDRRDVPRSAVSRYNFGIYMALIGGLPLFVDAFAHQYLSEASRYDGVQPVVGNTMTAAYLALVSGGGGHFYRGSRFWGYVYFHLDNLLVYGILHEFARGERYNPSTGKYAAGKNSRDAAYTLLGILGAVKITEIVHAVTMADRIRAEAVREELFSVEPFLRMSPDMGSTMGLQFTRRL